ncbi:MAG TPA: glutamine--fructose-6-phosphate aminotransferase, partial [Thermoanaerobaculia bacterium]|nr:glutamine--fructose-6-phosphate aminotransferase [Thermoanaerobaculia bacterium]
MCGIVGYVGPQQALPILLSGLKRLEYRGYDSAGIAVLGDDGVVRVARSEGKLDNLVPKIAETPLPGRFGVGHTRWATHGRPSEENAHPHRDESGRVVVIHNGIIENFLPLKKELLDAGVAFQSETDTEVVAQAIGDERRAHPDEPFEKVVRRVLKRLRGMYALVLFSADEP